MNTSPIKPLSRKSATAKHRKDITAVALLRDDDFLLQIINKKSSKIASKIAMA
jgi:hypothetical protein